MQTRCAKPARRPRSGSLPPPSSRSPRMSASTLCARSRPTTKPAPTAAKTPLAFVAGLVDHAPTPDAGYPRGDDPGPVQRERTSGRRNEAQCDAATTALRRQRRASKSARWLPRSSGRPHAPGVAPGAAPTIGGSREGAHHPSLPGWWGRSTGRAGRPGPPLRAGPGLAACRSTAARPPGPSAARSHALRRPGAAPRPLRALLARYALPLSCPRRCAPWGPDTPRAAPPLPRQNTL